MKNFCIFLMLVMSITYAGAPAYAQGEENRMKIEMTLVFGGKTVVTELSSFGTSLVRNYDEPAVTAALKKGSEPLFKPGSVTLSIEVKRVTDELLQVLGRKENVCTGSVRITDTYGKLPTRNYSFKQVSLASYSEQIASASNGENYGYAFFSLACSQMSINGILVE